MNEIKELLDELIEVAIDSIYNNEKLIDAVTKYCWNMNSKLIKRGFNEEQAFQLTKVMLTQSYK